jgi:hypothetical protein
MMFDGNIDNLKLFLQQIIERGAVSNWGGILNIPDSNGVLRRLTLEYNMLTLADVQAHSATYMPLANRNAQNSSQLYTCLTHSLTEDTQRLLLPDVADFTDANGRQSGTCYLKVLISAVYLNTNATSAFIRTNLANLPAYMATVDSDILKFNQYVKGQVADLAGCGQTTNDLLIHLFAGYAAASDDVFVQYIAKKRDLFDEGAETTPQQLMLLADNKYKTMKQAGTWRAPTKENEQLVAMSAQLAALKAKNARKHKRGKPNNKGFPPAQPGKDNKKNKDGFPKQGQRVKDYGWKKVPPTSGENTKRMDGKTYHWCKKHIAWTLHTPAECRLELQAPQRPREQPNESLQIDQRALATMIAREGSFYEE